MAQLTVRAASAFDFLHAIDISGRCWVRHRGTFGQQAMVLAESEAITLTTDAGALVVVAGIHEDPRREGGEAWFAHGPALKPNLRAALDVLHNALTELAAIVPGFVVRAYIDPRSVAGDRLAYMLGFDEAGVEETRAGPLKVWRRVL